MLLLLLLTKVFAKNSSKNSNLDDTGISLFIFPSKSNLKLHNIQLYNCITYKMVELDSWKSSGPDCIPLLVLKNCDPELSYILVELFIKCLKESCFIDCWKVLLVVPVLKNVGEIFTAKICRPVILLCEVSKVFEKLVNNRIVDYQEKYVLFLISSTVLGQTIIYDRVAKGFKRSGATRWFSFQNWIGAFILSLLLKLPPRKLKHWLDLWIFFLLRLLLYLYKSTYRVTHGILL